MASPESAILDELFDSILATMAAKPDMELGAVRELLERCGEVSAEPGGFDYLETEVAGTPCLWAVPKDCAQDRVLLSVDNQISSDNVTG